MYIKQLTEIFLQILGQNILKYECKLSEIKEYPKNYIACYKIINKFDISNTEMQRQ
jgi:hypothetical protein